MFKKILFPIAAFALLLTQTVSAEVIDVKNWSTVSDVAVSGAVAGSSEWFIAELPGDILKKSSNTSLDDIRVIDSTNTEIPYVVVRQGSALALPESSTVEGREVKVLENSLANGPQGQDRIMVLEIPVEGRVYNGLILQIAAQSTNFRKLVNIAVSDVRLGATSPSWRELEARPVIYNYSDRQGLFVQKNRVDFVGASSRYIRLRFEQDPALAGTGVQFTNNVVVDSARVVYEADTVENGVTIKNYLAGAWIPTTSVTESAVIESTKENTQTKATEVTYKTDNPLGFVGANKITIQIDKDETNFKRQVTVWAGVQEGTEVIWKSVGNGQVYRINSPVYQGESTSVSFPPTSANFFKVIIQNNNDIPLRLDNGAVVELQKVAVLFKKEDKNLAGVKLVVGNKTAYRPSYEIQTTMQYFDSVVPQKAVVQNVKDNPLYTTPADTTPFGEKYKWLLNVALVVFVLLIALLGWKWRAKHEVPNPPQNGITEPGNEN